MRLGQLARKLGVSPSDIMDFLGNHQIALPEGSNTRLEQDHVGLVLQHFSPAMMETILSPAKTETEEEPVLEEPQQEDLTDSAPVDIQPETSPEAETADESPISQFTPLEPEKNDLIKAPKIELPGLKVVGKIDLPEPKKKEPKPVENAAGDTPESQPEEKNHQRTKGRRQGNKRQRHNRSDKNPIALQREREARAAEKKKQLQKQLEKERRTQRYLKKIKPAVPTKPARIFDEQVVEMSAEQEQRPATLWGRFLKWFWHE